MAQVSQSNDRSVKAGRNLVLAWVSVALVPVAIAVGRAASNTFLTWRGYGGFEKPEPPGIGLLAFLVMALVVLIPVAAACWFGIQAARGGRPSGRTAAATAATIGGGLVLLGLPLFLSRVLGWPAVLACGVVIAAVGIAVVNMGQRHRPKSV